MMVARFLQRGALAFIFSLGILTTLPAQASQPKDAPKEAKQEIAVLRLAPPGANGAMWADAVLETLTINGYKPKLIALTSCREGRAWIEAHPKEAVVFATFTDYAIIDKINPNHPAACGFDINEETLIGVVGQWWNFICGHAGKNDSIEALRSGKNQRIGVWNFPISHNVAKAHMTALGVDGTVIGFASGKQQMLAFSSGDLDYIILSSENLARSLNNANCFATAAQANLAAQYMPGRVSYETVADIPFNGFGIWPFIAGLNVDTEKLRQAFVSKPGELYIKLQAQLVPETRSIQEQVAGLNHTAEQLKELVR